MPSRTSLPNVPAPSDESEFTFHLVGKKAIPGTSGSIVGAIVAGPVATFIGGAMGTAFDGGSPGAVTPGQYSEPGKAVPKKTVSKPKGKRRRGV